MEPAPGWWAGMLSQSHAACCALPRPRDGKAARRCSHVWKVHFSPAAMATGGEPARPQYAALRA
eukprot:2926897-Pyramimonas_sp.AAC.1